MSSFSESLHGWARVAWVALLALSVASAWSFPVCYATLSPMWRRSEGGRHAMAFSVATAYAVSAYGLRFAFGEFPGRGIVMFSALFGLGAVGAWRTWIYFRVRRNDRARAKWLSGPRTSTDV